ncbi:MAG: methyltransferase domain-containing protein [Dehalococcoidia bacterium]|nr:methyltransferase domain-containing protein [Dehalococcoidia bacterium]MCB9486414.1 methyltransferase domain-containing protein [Thermoflexaceae bacterium]
MNRRRKTIVGVRQSWARTPWARLVNSQEVQALVTPRAERIIQLIDLAPGRRYVDFGCGTAAFAHLLARKAGLDEPPLTLDLAPGPGPVDAIAWPADLPLASKSVDCLTSLYFARRFDDDNLHAYGREIARVLAPGGAALLLEVAPVRARWLDRLHHQLLSPGCAHVDLRGWGRMAALLTEAGFDAIDLVNVGPFLFPPIPRVGVLLRRA